MSDSVNRALIKKAEQIRTGTEILVSKTSDWQVIREYLCNRLAEEYLTPVQLKKLERYQFIYNQSSSGKYTKNEIINQVTRMFKPLSISQAYEDYNCTQEVFASTFNLNKRFELLMELESAQSMKRACIELNDYKTAAIIQKNIIALKAMLPDQEENPGELFKGHTIEMVFDPTLLGAPDVDMNEVLKVINEKRNKKINIDMFEELKATYIQTEEKPTDGNSQQETAF